MFTNKIYLFLISAITIVASFVLLSSVVFARSIYIPGTPPKLELIVKSVNTDSGFIATEVGDNTTSCPCFYISKDGQQGKASPGYYGIASIRKEGPVLGVSRLNDFWEEVNKKIYYYPAISLLSKSKEVDICREGYYSDCEKQKNEFTGLGSLAIYPAKETFTVFYDYYVSNRAALSLSDWEVEGKLVGDKENKNKLITNFKIIGNYKYTPPSDEWMGASKNYQENFQRNQRNSYVVLGILIAISGLMGWAIFKKIKPLALKVLLLALLVFVTALIIFGFWFIAI